MKKILFVTAFLLTAFVVSSQEKVLAIADPFILEHDGAFYAYGTRARNGIAVYSSKDLKNWEGPCGLAPDGLALHKNDSWGEKWFWAPEVYPTDSGFVMVYSVEERTALAFSDNVLGPFKQEEPFSVYIPEHNNIDNHIFVDDDGQAYMYWVYWHFNRGNEIFVAKLSSDFRTITGPQIECLHSQPGTWEVAKFPDGHISRVLEGPYVIKHKGLYYLTYSANDYHSQDYAVGYAVSNSPLGPWKRFEGNPILHRPGDLVGTGHHSFFTTSSGDNYIVFHAHKDKESVQSRRMFIAPYRFEKRRNMPDRLVVDTKAIITPLEIKRASSR